ncbi:unnamed protein product [Coffea canephora]|uniref:DH200=94 genomic scaffold, scaffold_4353 n=1 Tax=Coffea canephora TaxID=49390 RepID=A0A068VKX1_COFCA|nr:unnamed protein product [Coffea canephora]
MILRNAHTKMLKDLTKISGNLVPLSAFPVMHFFIYARGDVTKSVCPYKCTSKRYRMPNSYTPFEELIILLKVPGHSPFYQCVLHVESLI